MNLDKICPVFNIFKSDFYECKCTQEKCAWWIENKQKCAIAVLATTQQKRG